MMFKLKAKAEQEKLQAEGMQRGEDFVDCKSHLCADASEFSVN